MSWNMLSIDTSMHVECSMNTSRMMYDNLVCVDFSSLRLILT